MLPSEQLLDDLAGTVLDGGDVDWAAAESSADADIRQLVRHMRLVASVAEVHRQPLPGDGETWGHLRLLERVGCGAFGEVFRAWDTRLDREVALKLLTASPDSDSGGVIIREGRLLARVRHPNVVTIHGAERVGDRVGLWMEFVHGRTLEDLLTSGTTFTPDEVVHIGVEIARAVAAVHAAGLLHRDVKAQNVMRADDGRIVLMDFGSGRELDDERQALTGTPLYLAPELFGGGPATAASDTYSLGVLLFHLLTKSHPVHETTLEELRRAHEAGRRTKIRAARTNVPSGLARVIDRALDPRPERRFQTADALAAALRALTRVPPSSAEIVPKVRSVTSQPIKYVLSTHHHGDHTGGHPEFIKTAEIIAHRNARENMVKGKQAAPPRIVFNDQAAVFLGGVEVETRHLGRGHTNGDAVIYFRDLRTVHTGDLVVWGKRTDGSILTPFMDYPNGGSLIDWIGTLDRVLQLDFDSAIPGHGPVLSKADVEAFRQKLVTLRQRAQDLVKSGVQRTEFMAKLKTDDLNWPFPKERIEPLYDELSAKR